MKLMLLVCLSIVSQMSFAGGSSSSLTVNVTEEDTGKGYVYVSADTDKPAEDQIGEGSWWTISSLPQNTSDDNATHTYHVFGMGIDGAKFMGVKKVIEEGVHDELIPADENGQCTILIECVNPANVAIYDAVFETSTGIATPDKSVLHEKRYNIQGLLVGDKARGLYITNGKKVLVK